MTRANVERRTTLGRDIEEAFAELAAALKGSGGTTTYEVQSTALTPERIRSIRRAVAPSTKEFEKQFHIPARTMEAYEQGRRHPDASTQALLRVIEREPEAVRRALARDAA